jgi:2-keto-4-pentenoate hydratase/2-oxohepta-3-ene-1,7-dioic acid hydratase in catechol pathway
MKLLTFVAGPGPRLGVVVGREVWDANLAVAAHQHGKGHPSPYAAAGATVPSSLRGFLEGGADARRALEDSLAVLARGGKVEGPRGERVRYPLDGIHFKAPVLDPPKIIAIGLNYADHAKEGGNPIPDIPMTFAKYPNAVLGHREPIVYPKSTQKLDYEVELAVVIGRRGKYISKGQALEFVGGYTIFNDVSARDLQYADKQVMRGKAGDTFAPMGPFLVTPDEVGDPHKLALETRVNGEVRQSSNTNQFIFDVPHLVSFLSQFFTLDPGDVIATGTPPGVGIHRKPPLLLKPGDKVNMTIEKIGTLENSIVAESA